MFVLSLASLQFLIVFLLAHLKFARTLDGGIKSVLLGFGNACARIFDMRVENCDDFVIGDPLLEGITSVRGLWR